MAEPNIRLFTKAETARKLRISVATLDRRIADGSIEYYKNGWHVLFDDQQIQDYLSKTRNGLRERPSRRNAPRNERIAA